MKLPVLIVTDAVEGAILNPVTMKDGDALQA